MYCINEPIRIVKTWQPQRVLIYGSGLRAKDPAIAEWSDAACGDQAKGGRRGLGYLVAHLPSSSRGTCHEFYWFSRFTERAVKCRSGGDVYAIGELVGHAGPHPGFYASFLNVTLGMAGMAACELSFLFAELARQFRSSRWRPARGASRTFFGFRHRGTRRAA